MQSPTHAVVGCTDLAATAAFLRLFGFEVDHPAALPAAAALGLYGLDAASREQRARVPGAATGWLRLVETPAPARKAGTFDPRAFAIDLFTRDVAASLKLASAAGFECSEVAEHRFGPVIVREAEVHGPDHLILTLLQVDKRRPSLLDAEPDRLHSEVHSFVYSVREADRCIAFWQACGLKKVTDAPFGGTTLAIALGLPPREIRSRFVVFVDEADKPVRVQLLEFLGEGGELIPDWPLAGGLHAVAFEVEELEAACAALPTARFGDVVEYESAILGRARAVTGVGPGDQRFQIWQRQ